MCVVCVSVCVCVSGYTWVKSRERRERVREPDSQPSKIQADLLLLKNHLIEFAQTGVWHM